ncbi:MAG: YbhB/YbcL family Raf kinase inhibitor-like protein [Acidimicrobiia bacterium]
MAASAAAVLAAGLAGCARNDGRTLQPPAPGATAPPLPTAPTLPAGPVIAPASVLALTSPAFTPDGPIPAAHTCDGDDVAPPLAWSGVGEGTVELALAVTDTDADGFVHWAVTGISPGSLGLPTGTVPEGATESPNGFGRPGWAGPCPAAGDDAHRYRFTLYALAETSRVAADADGRTVVEALDRTAITAQSSLVGVYQRG